MIKIFKNRFGFYIKTLLVYGVLLAMLHCPSMQYENNADETEKLDEVAEFSNCTIDGTLNGYPITKMLQLIERCRAIDSEFHSHRFDLSHYSDEDSEDRVNGIKDFYKRVVEVSKKLRDEKGNFSNFIAGIDPRRSERTKTVNYLCSKGKCRYSAEETTVFSRKAKEKKAIRYASQVLNKNLNKIMIMEQRLADHIEKVRLKDAVAKAKSEKIAKLLQHPLR